MSDSYDWMEDSEYIIPEENIEGLMEAVGELELIKMEKQETRYEIAWKIASLQETTADIVLKKASNYSQRSILAIDEILESWLYSSLRGETPKSFDI